MAAAEGNKYALGNNGGRPRIYDIPDDLQKAVDEYFEYIKGESVEKFMTTENKKTGVIKKTPFMEVVREPEPATVTGLCIFIGFSSRDSLYEYQKKQEFSDIIKGARLKVENCYEHKLHATTNTGAIFALKNMGWRDKTETGFTDKDGEDLKGIPIVFK